MNTFTIIIPPQQVKRVIDGDTFAVYAFNVEGEEIIRVLGVDTPERKQDGYLIAKTFTEQWLQLGSISITVAKHDGFGRYLAKVSREDEFLDVMLISSGLGVKR